MRRLLRLYPAGWRRRYGAEMEALLHESRPGPREALDLARGALDAHLHPQWPDRSGPAAWLIWLALVVLAGCVNTWIVGAGYFVHLESLDGILGNGPVASELDPFALLVSGAWALGAILGFLGGLRTAGWFCVLMAARPISVWLTTIALTAAVLGGQPRTAAAVISTMAVWAYVFGPLAGGYLVGFVALRRARTSMGTALAVPLLAEPVVVWLILSFAAIPTMLIAGGTWAGWERSLLIALGPGGAAMPFNYAASVQIALWAGLLTAIAMRRRRRRTRGQDPPAGARVPAGPDPDAPEPLAARRAP